MASHQTRMFTPPEHAIATAVDMTYNARCQKSRRGAVIFDPETDALIGGGWNNPPAGRSCDGSDACRSSCARRCIHAESGAVRSLFAAITSIELESVHTRDKRTAMAAWTTGNVPLSAPTYRCPSHGLLSAEVSSEELGCLEPVADYVCGLRMPRVSGAGYEDGFCYRTDRGLLDLWLAESGGVLAEIRSYPTESHAHCRAAYSMVDGLVVLPNEVAR
jgi:hypothetical protein